MAQTSLEKTLHIKDCTDSFDATDAQENSTASALAYIGPLWIVTLLSGKESKFAKFHAAQGITLFIISVLWFTGISLMHWGLMRVSLWFWLLMFPFWLISFVFPTTAIFAAINAFKGRAKTLPFIGNGIRKLLKKED